jgi:hypothetical protein
VLQPKAVRRVATFEAKRQINSPIEKVERRIRELHDLGRNPVNPENLVNPVFKLSCRMVAGRLGLRSAILKKEWAGFNARRVVPRPSIDVRPPSIDARPPSIDADHRQSMPDHRQSTPDHRQSTPDHRQSTPDHRQSMPDHRQSTPDHRQSMPDHRQSTPDHRQSMPDYRQSTPDYRAQGRAIFFCKMGDHEERARLGC